MLLLGHVGIGSAVVRAISPQTPIALVLLGCALPDLLDQPMAVALGNHFYDDTTRMLSAHGPAHSLWIITLLGIASLAAKSNSLFVVTLCMGFHVLSDELISWLVPQTTLAVMNRYTASMPTTFWEELISYLPRRHQNGFDLTFEIIGLLLLIAQFLVMGLSSPIHKHTD